MTQQEFLTTFTKHLYVGGAKRVELIHELQTHLDELESNESPETHLGNPRNLARTYNHEHLGLLSSIGFMYSMPSIVALLAMSWLAVQNDMVVGVLWIMIIVFILIAPVWVSMRVFQMHQAKRKITLYVLLTPILSAVTLTIASFCIFTLFSGYNPLDLLTHADWKSPAERSVFIWKDQFSGALVVSWFGYFFSFVIFLGTLFIKGLMKTNITIFPKKKTSKK
jgi:hypothetical protein